MSYPPNAGGQPPSFKTNVNRAKTKRWVEAKSYSYDGDDWGEADEYDEYGGYDEPPPPPRPTGLRQQGQSARSVPQGPYGSPADPYQRPMDNDRQEYGNTGLPQQYGQRSATNPQPRVDTELVRSNSFDRGDEKRAFSAGGFQPEISSPGTMTRQRPPSKDQHPNIQPSMQFDPKQMRPVQPDFRRPYPEQQAHQHVDQPIQEAEYTNEQPFSHSGPFYSDELQRQSIGNRTQSMTSNTSSMDFHNRRDFTPSAVPPPLHPKSSPTLEPRSSSSHPPRKSSLSQTNQPPISTPGQGPPVSTASEPGTAQRQRTASGADKPLPFVRPADIYKRMQDEKERERQSQESSRPSMDAITGRSEQSETSARQGHAAEPPETSSPILSPTPSHILDNIEAKEHGRLLQPTLGPVAERKSEYDMDGFQIEPQPSNDREPQEERAPAKERVASPVVRNTLSPVLPEVARMSSFGDSFLGSSGSGGEPSLQALLSTKAIPRSADQEPPTSLQHQPSSGYRSLVNQAFDITDDQIPPTPTSTAGSGVERSTSGGTSVISPIISRDPSAAAVHAKSRNTGTRARTPSLPEENEDISSRPISSSSVGAPKQVARKPSPSQTMPTAMGEPSPPPSFIPGHRRDLSTPSPGNSPARTPMLEANKQLRQPQEAEVAMSTPTQPTFTSAASKQETALNKESDASSIRSLNEPRKRSESPSKSRVRDLADKFEGATSSRRGSDQSLSQRGETGATSPQRPDIATPSRPLVADRMESFRPHLPGGWTSYTSNAHVVGLANRSLDHKDSSPILEEPVSSQRSVTDLEAPEARSSADSSNLPQQESRFSDRQAETSSITSSSAVPISTAPAKSTSKSSCEDDGQSGLTSSHAAPLEHALEDPSSPEQHRVPLDTDFAEEQGVSAKVSNAPTFETADHPEITSPITEPTPNNIQTPKHLTEPAENAQTTTTRELSEPQSEQAIPLARPPTLSSLNTDGGSQYESDRLRREIFRSLTPNETSEPTTAESDSPYQDEPRGPIRADIHRHGPAHESMVIPSEYDSYWNRSESMASTRSNSEQFSEATPSAIPRSAATTVLPPTNTILSPRLQRLVSEPRVETQRPAQLTNRFSWEQASAPEAPTNDMQADESEIRPPGSELVDSQTIRPSLDGDGLGARETSELDAPEHVREHPSAYLNELNAVEPSRETPPPQHSPEPQDLHSEPRDSGTSPVADLSTIRAPSPDLDRGIPSVPPFQGTQTNIPAFREISALKTPFERIRGFNEAREQYAHQDSGLAHWLTVTVAENPEHADVLSSAGRRPATIMSHKPSSSRLLSGFRSSGTRSDSSDAAGPGVGQSSYSPGGGSKLATQQVQAKGKDLLHSAGVFGGKANVAAKGLFSKGRSKFRGTGSAEKGSTPPSSPDQNTRGRQPQLQPPDSSRNADPDIHSPQSRPLSYVQCVDDFETQEYLPKPHHEKNHPPFTIDSREGDRLQRSSQFDQERAYPARNDSLVPPNSRTNEGDVGESFQSEPSILHGNGPVSFKQSPANAEIFTRTRPSDDAPTNAIGIEPPAPRNVQQQHRSSPPSDKRSSLQQHFASQAESMKDAIGPPSYSRQEPSPPKTLIIPRSRFSSQQANNDSVPPDPKADRSMSQQSTANRQSEDSSSSFHTAEHSHDQADSGPAQEDLETPKAEKPPPLLQQNRSDQPPVTSVTSEKQPSPKPQAIYAESSEHSQIPSASTVPTVLAREPSLDNVSDIVHSDLPPSPVSPQHSFIQEPSRHDGRRGPVYYGPDHGFGPASDHLTAAAPRSGSFGQHSHGPSLEDHPAFRRNQSPSQQRFQQSAGPYIQGRVPDETSLSHQQGVEPGLGNKRASTDRLVDSSTNAKRNSRNSGFFKVFKSPTVTQSNANGSSDQSYATPTRSPIDGQKKSKRNSLFGSRNGDKTNGSGQSEESSPTPSSRVDALRQPTLVASSPGENSSPSSGTSNKLRDKLQRTSTSGNREAESGKKKRFSAIGSLFGSRSRKVQQSPPTQSRQPQPVTFYQFDEPSQHQESERQVQQREPHQRPKRSESRPSFQKSSRQSSSTQPQSQPPREGYYAPAQSEPMGPPRSTSAWSQTAQRVSQPTEPSVKEPPAYSQDAALRQRSTAPPEAANSGQLPTSATFPKAASNDSPSTRSRSSIWSRSKTREVPLSKRHDRSTSGNSWTTTNEEPIRQSTYSISATQKPESASSSRPNVAATPSNEGRILTYSQFGESNITYPPPQSATKNPVRHSHQPSSERQPLASIVTFHQFPQQQATGDNSPPPPPPPPKDDWHVSRPRHSSLQQASNTQVSSDRRTSHQTRSGHNKQEPASHQPTISSQAPTYSNQPPPTLHSRQPSHSPQPQRQSLPPLQTEVQNRRSGTFSSEKPSAKSRKARQRELEMGGTRTSTIKLPPMEPAAKQGRKEEENEEPIVMSSSSYPGMEWTPDRWEDD